VRFAAPAPTPKKFVGVAKNALGAILAVLK
jgi:hypothetical protein